MPRAKNRSSGIPSRSSLRSWETHCYEASLLPITCEEERLRPEKSEVNRLLGDASKLRSMTDWKPQYTFEQGLAETIAFLRENLDSYKIGKYIL